RAQPLHRRTDVEHLAHRFVPQRKRRRQRRAPQHDRAIEIAGGGRQRAHAGFAVALQAWIGPLAPLELVFAGLGEDAHEAWQYASVYVVNSGQCERTRSMSNVQGAQGGARVRLPPPLVFLASILVGVGLRYLRPLAVGSFALVVGGVALVVAGLGLAIA